MPHHSVAGHLVATGQLDAGRWGAWGTGLRLASIRQWDWFASYIQDMFWLLGASADAVASAF